MSVATLYVPAPTASTTLCGDAASAWQSRRFELAHFAAEHLVARWNTHVRRRILDADNYVVANHGNVADFPNGVKVQAYSVDLPVYVVPLAVHFNGREDCDIISLYPVEPDGGRGRCRFGVIDIDHDDSDEGRAASLAKAREVAGRCESLGLSALVEDSGGGHHVWLRFDDFVPADELFRLLWGLRGQAENLTTVDEMPLLVELFPGATVVDHHSKGLSIRLPGRKPGTGHWSTFLVDGEVVSGEAAVDAMLAWPANEAAGLPGVLTGLEARDFYVPAPGPRRRGDSVDIAPGSTPLPTNDRRYVIEALESCYREVAEAAGGRNVTIFARACRVGNFLHYNVPAILDPDRVFGRLWEAAEQCGAAIDDPAKTEDTIRRALEQGLSRPFYVPGSVPPAESPDAPATPGPLPTFANYEVRANASGKPFNQPRQLPDMIRGYSALTGGWPKVVGEYGLFYYDSEADTLREFRNATALRAWTGMRANVEFADSSPGLVPWSVFHDAVCAEAQRFVAVEKAPHFPPVENIFYAHRPVLATGDGRALEGLLELLRPATDLDRELVRLLVATLCWGGPAGQRPAFLIQGPEEDPLMGRGVGKTTLAEQLASLVGGTIDGIDPSEPIGRLNEKVINDLQRRRVLLLDNLKIDRFSWAGLEAFITKREITGKRMYVGTETRPNLMTVVLTINGAALCEDMAQRAIPIRVDRPLSMRLGDEGVSDVIDRYIREHRQAILADVRAWFGRPKNPFETEVRPGSWAADVLARCDDPEQVARLIRQRQSEINDDDTAAGEFEEKFGHLFAMHWTGDKSQPVVIRTEALTQLFNKATGERVLPSGVTRRLNRMKLTRLIYRRSSNRGRHWVWYGPGVSLEAAPGPGDWAHVPALDGNRN